MHTMHIPRSKSALLTLFLLALVTASAMALTINKAHSQREQTTDDPFVVIFSIGRVDNTTGFIASWVTANNLTVAALYNASEVDLIDANPKDGFVEGGISFPNGTLHTGDVYEACYVILKDVTVSCDVGINAPTNRAEFISVLLSPTKEQEKLQVT
jgi:hypothetical protein